MKIKRNIAREILKNFITKIRNLPIPFFRRYREKTPYVVAVLISLFVVVGGLNLFIELTGTLKTETLARYDKQVTDFMISFRSPALTKYFTMMTEIGDVNGYLIVLALSILLTALVIKRWKYVSQVGLVLVLATISNMMLKRFIDRARPGIEHLVVVKTLSYPSGHAMSAMAFYGFLIYLVYKFKTNKYLKSAIIVLLSVIILSIGLSRIYLGVHFPSDIVGGYIAGAIWVFFCILIFNLIEVFRKDPLT